MSDSRMPPLLDGLSPLEETVVDAARRGTWVEPATDLDVEQLAVTDDPGLRVRAELVRELLMGRRGELDPRGVLVYGVRVVGSLDLDHVTAVTSLSLVRCALPDGITCMHARLRHVVLGASLITDLNAEGLRTDGNLFVRDATITGTGTGTGEIETLRLLGAHIGGQLILDHSNVTNTTGTAVQADNLRTDGNLFVRDATITGTGGDAALRLLGAHIGGQFSLDRITVTNTTGPALYADALQSDGDLFVDDATFTGTGDEGTLRLLGAHIGGELDLDRITVTNTTGPALNAGNLRTDGELFMRDATFTGTGHLGALRLLGARIGGQAHLQGARLSNNSGLLLALTEAQVSAALFLPTTVICPHARLDTGTTHCPAGVRQVVLQGFVFSQLRDISWQEWLHLLVHHTPEYRPQPYQQLAAVERAAGHDNNARTILITQQDELRRRVPEALGGPIGRWRHWLWGWLGRYGYRAHRLVTALMIVLLLAGATGYLAGQITTRPDHHAAERVQPIAAPSTTSGIRCSTAELIGLGIDRGLPLGATGLRARCDLDTTTHWGQTLTYLLWALQALLWALATLAIAAYTGLVRKSV